MEATAGVFVRSAVRVLLESLQLQGARGLDQERASSGDTSDDQGPEQWLNICLVSEVFVQILATGVGTIAFIWATVVLLGGFSTFLHEVDFWVITGIVFIQAAKVVGLNSSTDANFFAQVPPAFLELGAEHFTVRRRPLIGDPSGRHLLYYIMLVLGSTMDFISLIALLTSVLLLLPLVAASSCIGLSIFRLLTITRHKQYRDSGADNSKANVLRAVIFFYALVLAQGGLFLIWLYILAYRQVLRKQVCLEYHLEGKDDKLIDKYINRTSSACIKTGVLNTINRKLVSFAIDLLHSEYSKDRVSGVQLLHTLTSDANKTHNARVIAHMQSSHDCIAMMLVLLSSKSGIDENSKVNLALIVTKISKGLRLSDVDGATESLSSLIDPYLTKISTLGGSVINVSQQGISQPPNIQNGENNGPLIVHGLEILAKLAQNNPDNCTKIFSTKDLFPKIIAPISNKLYKVFTEAPFTDDENYGIIAIEITEKSLRVVSKLVQGTHDINRKIREEICEKKLVVDIIHPILELEHPRYNNLKVAAIKILSQLELAKIVGDGVDAKVKYIDRLMGLLFDESISIKKAAGKALELLAADSRTTHCTIIMNWSRGAPHTDSVVQQLSCVLPDDDSHPRRSPDPSYRNAVAQLLTQFCVHSTHAETMVHLKSILHEVLDVIIREVDEALGIENRQQNRRPGEVILNFFAACVDTSSCASRQGNRAPGTPLQLRRLFPCLGTSSPPNQSGGGNTLQNHTVAGSQNPRGDGGRPTQGIILSVLRQVNRLVNMPGAYSNLRNSDRVKAQLASTPIEAGSRKTLVAFLGLALQICEKLSDAAGLDDAVARSTRLSDGADLVDKFKELVDRFEKIIAMCNTDAVGLLKGRASVDYLMMIKSVTKLCAWVMRQNSSYVAYFLQKDIDLKLEGALKAMGGLELGVLLTCSADQLTNYETLSSTVEAARRPIIESRQNTP